MPTDTRPLDLTKIDANTLYEALVLLGYFQAKAERPDRLPYSADSIEALEQRILTAWPELRKTHAPGPNRAQRRARP